MRLLGKQRNGVPEGALPKMPYPVQFTVLLREQTRIDRGSR